MKKILLILPLVLLFSCGMSKDGGTISVSGTGEVSAAPDTARLSVTVSEKAKTTKEAQDLANDKMAVVLKALKDAGVEDKDLQTSSVSFANDYVWNPDTRRNEVTGRVVSQTVSARFKALDQSPKILASALDTLGAVDGIEIGNLQFSLEDPQPRYVEARRLAFEKAKQKAEELAGYAGVKLGKALTIAENSGPVPLSGNVQFKQMSLAESDNRASTDIPGGEISISYGISVVFRTN